MGDIELSRYRKWRVDKFVAIKGGMAIEEMARYEGCMEDALLCVTRCLAVCGPLIGRNHSCTGSKLLAVK